MALIDVVHCEMKDGIFCEKFPSDNLKLGSQLVVYPSQVAIFVHGGKICDIFEEGTYTLKTENIPILNKAINLPFGKESPFKADVWFVNLISKLNLLWGTPQPIQIEDPKYKIIVPVRANGQYGIKVSDPTLFLKSVIGNMSVFTSEQIGQYVRGRLVTFLNTILSQQIIQKGDSVLEINTQLIELSEKCESHLNTQFKKYGIGITEFTIASISVPQDDPSVVELKRIKELCARLNIAGTDVYQMVRRLDILETAAGNTGAGGAIAAMGAGLGVGVGTGSAIGQMAGQYINPTTPPPLPQEKTFYIVINGNQLPSQTLQQIATFVQQGVATADTLVWTTGMPNWMRMTDVPELASLVNNQTPPSLPNL